MLEKSNQQATRDRDTTSTFMRKFLDKLTFFFLKYFLWLLCHFSYCVLFILLPTPTRVIKERDSPRIKHLISDHCVAIVNPRTENPKMTTMIDDCNSNVSTGLNSNPVYFENEAGIFNSLLHISALALLDLYLIICLLLFICFFLHC